MWGYGNVAPTEESIDAKNIDAAVATQRKRLKFDTIMAKQATQHKKEKMARADGAAYRGRTEDTQIDEMGAFMSSPLPTPMSMRKEPSMTKPLMLTKKMNTAATLIKKAGNTPKLPTNEGAIAGHLRKVRALKDAGNSKVDAHAQSKKMGTPAAYVDMVYNQKKEANYEI